jgi:hypothetical protein
VRQHESLLQLLPTMRTTVDRVQERQLFPRVGPPGPLSRFFNFFKLFSPLGKEGERARADGSRLIFGPECTKSVRTGEARMDSKTAERRDHANRISPTRPSTHAHALWHAQSCRSSHPVSCSALPFMIHLDHPPSVSTPTTQPLALQSNDHFSWNSISTAARDTEPRALNKDGSPSVPSASIVPPFSPDKTIQKTSPIPRQSSLTPPPSSPQRDGEAEAASAPPTVSNTITAPTPSTHSQGASPDPPLNPQHDPAVENPPPSRPLTPLSELSPVPDNDEDASPDAQGADKGEGSSSLQPTFSSPSRQIPVNPEATSSHIRVSPSRPHPTSSDQSSQRGSFSAPSGAPSIPKASFVLQINTELIKCALPTSASPYSC